MEFTMSSESLELEMSFDSENSKINFIALSKWPPGNDRQPVKVLKSLNDRQPDIFFKF